MINLLKKTLSPQAVKVYTKLLKSRSMSAKEIGRQMHIIPNSVYRNVKELIQVGLVQEIYQYPILYQAKPVADSVELYISVIRQNFYETFGLQGYSKNEPKISFFQNRKDFLKQSDKDTTRAKNKINLIISGHEVPAETILSFKQAVVRGVRVRALVQELHSVQMLENWQKIGVEVKYIKNLGVRIVVYDSIIIHVYSYDPEHRQEAVGVRFDYAPYAALMDELFEHRWKLGKEIDGVLR